MQLQTVDTTGIAASLPMESANTDDDLINTLGNSAEFRVCSGIVQFGTAEGGSLKWPPHPHVHTGILGVFCGFVLFCFYMCVCTFV